MRKSLLLSFLSFFTFLTVFSQADRFAYVVTDVSKDGVNWSTLRKIDLQSNSFSDVLLNGSDLKPLAFDAATKKQFTEPVKDARFGVVANAAFGTGVAALAFDKKNNRLYYTPMFIDQLRYIDLKTMKVYFMGGTGVDALKTKNADQSNIITRMAIAADGNGYALTNDGQHLLQFTTGKKSKIVNLGALTDDPDNKDISIHSAVTSFGGDMIADDDGNLYVFSARNHVFRINIENRTASYLGAVSGLPAGFTINGAAVGEDNRIVVVSATNNNAIYSVDHKTWAATASAGTAPWRSSDLANSNLLAVKKIMPLAAVLAATDEIADGRIQLYPNPVSLTSSRFTIQYNQPEGKYTVVVVDVAGRQTIRAVATISGKGQTQTIQLPVATKRGVYLVKVVDQENKTIFSRKIVVQ